MKQTVISLAVILTASALSFLYFYEKHTSQESPLVVCPTDTMMCPDGSSVARSGVSCEFGVCPQELPSYLIEPTKKEIVDSSSTSLAISFSSTTKSGSRSDLFSTITRTASSLFQEVTKDIVSRSSSDLTPTNTQPATVSTKKNTTPYTTLPVTSINETRYSVDHGVIVDTNKTIIYTLPTGSANNGAGTGDSSTHTVNVVPVSTVPPVINGIPVNGLPGKYYLSENTSTKNTNTCEFSNKIYILDTTTNQMTLLYEENNTTLSFDDARACNNEMYLLATDQEKLILKYHTIGTNTVCDSTWSEPEKTWYLDVTRTAIGTKRYFITSPLYLQAEAEERQCRLQYEATTTNALPAING